MVEKNLSSIIASNISSNNFDFSLKDINLNLNGKVSVNDFIIYNKEKDTVLYAKSFSASPTELVNYINNEKSSFKSLNLNGGFINANNFNSSVLLTSNQNGLEIVENFKFISIQNIGITDFDILIDQQGKKYNISNDEIKIENLLIKNSEIQFSVSDFKSKINAKEVSILSDVLIKDSDVRLDFEKFSYGNSIFTGIIHLKNVNEIKKFKYDGYFKNSTLNSSDFKTPITDLDIQIESFFEGNIDEIKFKDLNAKSLDNELITDLFVRFSKSFNDSDIAFELKSFDSSTTFIYSLFPDLFGTVIPSVFKNIGKLEMDGIFTKNDDIILSNANIKTEFGVIDYDIKLSNLKNINIAKYQGSFNGNSFDLAKIINLPFELQSDFSFSINGQGFDEENLKSSVVGQMNNVIINNYPYKKIMINGDVSDKQFTGSLIVDDNNLNLNFDGLINYSNDLVEYDFNANIKKANLDEINLSKVKKQSVFGNISAKLVGENFQSMIGDISFTDFILTGLDDEYKFENLTIQSRINNEKRFFNINSEDAVSGILIGDFNFLLLPTLMTVSYTHLTLPTKA